MERFEAKLCFDGLISNKLTGNRFLMFWFLYTWDGSKCCVCLKLSCALRVRFPTSLPGTDFWCSDSSIHGTVRNAADIRYHPPVSTLLQVDVNMNCADKQGSTARVHGLISDKFTGNRFLMFWFLYTWDGSKSCICLKLSCVLMVWFPISLPGTDFWCSDSSIHGTVRS